MPDQEMRYLFNTPKQCKDCHRELPEKYSGELCPRCKERELFSRVKEYIRASDVTEYMVANEFNIPLSKVKGWIREGRIEYKDLPEKTAIESLHCQSCGAVITFGNLCTQCQRKANLAGTTTWEMITGNTDERFHFLSNKE